MTPDIYVHILNLIEAIFFCEHCKNYRNFNQSTSVEILRKRTVSADPQAINTKICGNCPPTENLHPKKSENISAFYAVEATFAIVCFCLSFSADLNLLIKYVSDNPLKIIFVFPKCKKQHNFEISTTTCPCMTLDTYLL